MSIATVLLLDSNYLGNFYFTKDAVNLAKEFLSQGRYTKSVSLDIPYEGEEAAEELFDLTNNPSPIRQANRRVRYGNGRSLSVGDIVEVDNVKYLCRPNGWEIV